MYTLADTSAIPYIVKKLYSGKKIEDLAVRKHPFLAMVKKEGGFTGESYTYLVDYANPQSVSNTFSDATTGVPGALQLMGTGVGAGAAEADSMKGVKFELRRKTKYATCRINAEFIYSTKNDAGAFVRGLKSHHDKVINEMGRRSALELYGDGGGALGRRSSASTNVITLTVPTDVSNFAVGMRVVANTASTGVIGTQRANTDVVYVTAKNEAAGTITLSDASDIDSFANNDYLFAAGDQATGISGLAAWIPLTAPGSTAFFGVDRSVDPNLLGGWRRDSSSDTIEENAMILSTFIMRAGGSPDALLLNPVRWMDLARSLRSKGTLSEGKDAKWGFKHLELALPTGDVKVYADPDCPMNRGYILQMDTWFVKHMEAFPHVVEDDNLKSLRSASYDAVETRFRQWWQLGCKAPGYNGVFSLPST
jgi:hypothetical protein